MNPLDEFTSLTTVLEKFIARENESITVLERTVHNLGETVVSSLLHRLIEEKQHHRLLLEQALEEAGHGAQKSLTRFDFQRDE